MKRKIIITCIAVLIKAAVCVIAFSQDTVMCLSVKEACKMGIERNVEVRNSELEQSKRKSQLSEARSNFYPQLDGYSTFSNNFAIPKLIVPGEIFGQSGPIPVEIGTKFDWSSGFRASQILYNQSYFTSLKILKSMENLSAISTLMQKEEVVYQVTQVYFLCKYTEKQVEHLTGNLANMDRLADITRSQSDNGMIRKVDHDRVVVNRANIQSHIDNLQYLHKKQLGLLCFLVGLDLNSSIILTDSLAAGSLYIPDKIFDPANKPGIQIIEAQIEITSLSKKSKLQESLPSLTGYGQYYFQGQRNQFDFLKGGADKFYKVGVIGVSLHIPIFNGFDKRWSSARFETELLQLRNTLDNAKKYLSKEYSDAISQYKNSVNIISRQEENIRTAMKVYNINLLGYTRQVVPLSDLILAEDNVTEARLSYLTALLQLKNAELDLRKVRGELLEF
ncbi:MAG: TolC family protein [Bacteroidales bacterium]|jgi:outer membrane protein TolC|nr:TolC family protein [Bacteroidales bacterium]